MTTRRVLIIGDLGPARRRWATALRAASFAVIRVDESWEAEGLQADVALGSAAGADWIPGWVAKGGCPVVVVGGRVPGAAAVVEPNASEAEVVRLLGDAIHPGGPVRFGLSEVRVDLNRRRATRGREAIPLTANETGLLAVLARAAGEPVSREQLLGEVWGYTAAVVTRSVDNAVQRLRAKIEAEPKRPRHLLTVRGAGYRLIDLREEPDGFDGIGRAPPRPPVPFIGRSVELETLRRHLRERARLIAVTGPAGIGKSALVAASLSQHDRDVSWLSAETGPVISQLAHATGLRATDLDELITRIGTRVLLVDEADPVLPELSDLLPGLLAGAPSLTVVLTCRCTQAPPGAVSLVLGPLGRDEALRLLAHRVELGPWATESTLDTLIDRVDRRPLGVLWLAARLALLSPPELLERLDADPTAILRDPGLAPRHRSLHASGWVVGG